MTLNRNDAWNLLCEYTQNENLRKHALAVEACARAVARESALDCALFACDEMAGFLTACSLVKPGKTIFEVEADSVKRKMKDKAFARGVSRDDLVRGAQELGVSLEDHIATCIAAMRQVAPALGLEPKSQARA